MHLRAVIFSALPPILLYPSNAWCLTVRDRFWVDFDSDVPGNCGSYSDKLDNAVTELPAMLRETTRALNLIRDPVENLPEGSVERADWYYFMMLFSALFDPLQTAEPTDDFSSQTDHLDPAGLDDSDVWDEVRVTIARLSIGVNTPYDGKKHLVCENDWYQFKGADEEDPISRTLNPTSAEKRLMKQTFSGFFSGHAADEGLWYRATLPPNTSPTYQNSLVRDGSRQKHVDKPFCDGVTRNAAALASWQIIVFCFKMLEELDDTLQTVAQRLDADASAELLSPSVNDRALSSVSEKWLHEFLHMETSIRFKDEPAVSLADGSPYGGNQRAYGWDLSVALARWDRPRALKNVDNYLMFIKVVYLRKLIPNWEFLSGSAVRRF